LATHDKPGVFKRRKIRAKEGFEVGTTNPVTVINGDGTIPAVTSLEDRINDLVDPDTNAIKGALLPAGTPDAAAEAVAATGVLKISSNPADGKIVTIGTVTYTFVEDLTAEPVANEVKIQVDPTDTVTALINAINGGAGEGTTYSTGTVVHPLVTAALVDNKTDEIAITAKTAGVAGNTIATTDDLTADGDGFSKATLEDGADAVAEGAGVPGQIKFDADNLYICIAENNWKKIALTEY
jgi:hypothetical protein